MRNEKSFSEYCNEAFLPFIRELADATPLILPKAGCEAPIRALLDGAAGAAVKKHVPRTIRAEHGIFFSGHQLANAAIRPITKQLASKGSVFDPACGAGDLLIAAAWNMPLRSTLQHTLDTWGRTLGGCDIHASFVDAARWRLLMLAMLRHRMRGDNFKPRELRNTDFPNILTDDFFNTNSSGYYDYVVTNPPFVCRVLPTKYSWSSGNIQLAGAFLDKLLEAAPKGQRIIAILPEVLRAGTRYGKWRCMIESQSSVNSTKPYGRFDLQTDVDVFILDIERRLPSPALQLTRRDWIAANGKSTLKVGDLYSVHVGPVVPHRANGKGAWHRYLEVKSAPAFGTINSDELHANIRFTGRVFTPPFVALRRTSNPSDKHRVISTLITGHSAVAVENHLIVIKPHTGSLQSCRRLHKQLSSSRATRWMNELIRCRHITTEAIKLMPIWEATDE